MRISWRTHLAVLIGTEKLSPCAPAMIAVLIPTTFPASARYTHIRMQPFVDVYLGVYTYRPHHHADAKTKGLRTQASPHTHLTY